MVVTLDTPYTVLSELTFLKVLIEEITFFMLQHDDEMMMR